MARLSNSVPIQVTGTSAPAWFSSLAHKQWAQPTNNAAAIAANAHWLGASAVIPSPLPGGSTAHRSLVDAYTGMGVDNTRKWVFLLGNGGHNDYYGNEVYSCDLTSASPQWVRRRNPSPSPPATGTVPVFPDGRPCGDHTGNLTVEAEGRWFNPGMGSTNFVGNQKYVQWWEYSVPANAATISGGADDWINLGDTHPGGNPNAVTNCSVWDPVSRQIIVLYSGNVAGTYFQSIDNMSGSPALSNTNPLPTSQNISADIDTTNRILFARIDTNAYRKLSLANNTTKVAQWQTVTVTGTGPPRSTHMVWHNPSQAFLSWNGGQSIYKLTPTVVGGTYTGATWTTVACTGITPATHNGAGMWKKVNIIPDMGDGTAAFVVLSRYGNPSSVAGADLCVCRLTGAV